MMESRLNISKRSWLRVILVTILFVIVGFSIAGEKVACNDGIGWDGENYYTTMQHFIPMIKHHGYDQYAIRRIMPWGLTNVICALADVKVTKEIAIASGVVYNVIALILAVIFFFRISNLKNWKLKTEALGFALLFYTYPVLKMLGYYPVFCDIFAMALGIMMCYYFLADKKWALIVLGVIGATVWPSSPICVFALAFFPRTSIPSISLADGRRNYYIVQLLYVIVASIPLILLIIGTIQHNGHVMATLRDICPLTIPVSKWIIPLTCLCACAFYYYLVSAFKMSLPQFIKLSFTDKKVWLNYIAFVLCVIFITLISKFLANEYQGLLTPMRAIEWTVLTSMTDPFVFVENHFVYFGLVYLLILFFWRDLAKIIMQQGLGYLFIVALWVLFSIRPEARVSIMYLIFPVIALLMYLDTKEIKTSVVFLVILYSLIHSRFWYTINVPNMDKYLSWDNYWHYTEFPAQRYFMSQGHWQSHDMYYILTFYTIIVATIIYFGIQKKWFVVNK